MRLRKAVLIDILRLGRLVDYIINILTFRSFGLAVLNSSSPMDRTSPWPRGGTIPGLVALGLRPLVIRLTDQGLFVLLSTTP